MPLTHVDDFSFPQGWNDPAQASARTRELCETLENGGVLLFPKLPLDLPQADQEFLLAQKLPEGGPKNITYRPQEDKIRGVEGENSVRALDIMRRYSREATRFLGQLLPTYADTWSLYYATFRPEQEQGRNLPTLKRNDLMHVDTFGGHPTRGNRILRCFTNINPHEPRIWVTTGNFQNLAERYAREAGLDQATSSAPDRKALFNSLKRVVGLSKAAPTSPYDRFMGRFHDFLKLNDDFQKNSPLDRLELPPGSTWLCFTDAMPHAALSGQYAIEQTLFVPLDAMLAPEKAPLRVLEKIAGHSLVNAK